MREPAFTPGPWEATTKQIGAFERRYSGPAIYAGCPSLMVAETLGGCGDEGANAHLIAAAPRMYSACEALLERYRVMGCGDGPEALEAAAALKQARGEQ